MAVLEWNIVTIDGKRFLVVDVAKFRIPLDWDPSSNCFIAIAAPDGGLGNIPALLAGDDGTTPDIDLDINLTALDFDDPTPESASWDEISPNVYQLTLALRNGQKGDDGDTVLTPADYGTPVAGRLLRVKADLSGFELFAEKVGNEYLPASISAVPSGNPAFSVCHIGIDAQPFDYYVDMAGQTVVTGTGADVRVDLIARLETAGIGSAETSGPIVGRGFGVPGVGPDQLIFSRGRPPGSSASYGKVLAGNTATVHVRTERQAGSNTYTTVSDTSWASVRVAPIP